jgi:conjugative transfer signal peptidase TraF
MRPGTYDDPHAPLARTRPAWTTRPGGRAPRGRGPRSSLVLGVLVLAAVVSTRWVRLNLSPSVPVGVYRLARLAPPLARGTLVVLPVPVAVRPWRQGWAPLLKPVAAVAGDEVCVREGALVVRGASYGPVYVEADGKPLPHLEGCQVVPEGTVFLASAAPRSLDGRYWSMTPIADLTARALPLWTWRRRGARPHSKASNNLSDGG